MKKFFSEKNIRFIFDISLLIKGFDAAVEIVGGVVAYFITGKFFIGIIKLITTGELREDPHDFFANALLHGAHQFSVGTHYFIAFYLLIHGIVKLWLVIGLLRRKLWYYPTAMLIFSLFIVYQIYQYTLTSSVWLIMLTILDLIVILLTWYEYRHMRQSRIFTQAL